MKDFISHFEKGMKELKKHPELMKEFREAVEKKLGMSWDEMIKQGERELKESGKSSEQVYKEAMSKLKRLTEKKE